MKPVFSGPVTYVDILSIQRKPILICVYTRSLHLQVRTVLNCYATCGFTQCNVCTVYLTGNCREKHVLTSFYSKLVSILPVDNMKEELVSARIITLHDMQKINRETIDKSKASFILNIVDSSLEANATNNFYNLLKIMERSHNDDVKAIVRDIRRALVTGETKL